MTQSLVVVGAGGFGRETLDVVDAMIAAVSDLRLLGVVDDSPSELNLARLDDRGVPFLGTEEQFFVARREARFLAAIGDPLVRRRVVDRWEAAGYTASVAIHPSAGVGSRFQIGEGSVVCAGAQISTNVRIGKHAHVNPNATIGHDSALGDFVSVNPGAVVSGEVQVEDGVLIGAGAVVLQALRLGGSAVVGAAACVTRDVASGAVVKGIPAR